MKLGNCIADASTLDVKAVKMRRDFIVGIGCEVA
jgi:hypothetical protein